MRKHYKNKLHSCALCKPHKTGGGNRWKAKDLALLRMFEKTKRDIYSNSAMALNE